jgi:hypothetical protein
MFEYVSLGRRHLNPVRYGTLGPAKGQVALAYVS